MEEFQSIERMIEIAKSDARLEAYNSVFKKLIETLHSTKSQDARLSLIDVGDYIVQLCEKEKN